MDAKTLEELKEKAYKNACKKGFHDRAYRNTHWLALVAVEMSEAIEADRNGIHSISREEFEERMKNGESHKVTFERFVKDSVEDELADVVVRLLDFAGLRKIEFKTDLKKYKYSNKLLITEFAFSFLSKMVEIGVTTDEVKNLIAMVFSYSEAIGVDLDWHILAKMEYNKTRARLNGKNY